MPFWQRESAEEKQARERREGEQKASLAALQAGELPPQAQRRLQEQRKLGDNFFINDLTSSEHILTQEAGYEPISQVMGSAFYKVAYRGYFQGAYGSTGELAVLSHAQMAARELAVHRLRQEAQILGADGVIGVHLKAGNYDWSTNLVEFTAIGTAIRVHGRPTEDKPFTSDLSGQDFWTLLRAGYRPVGMVMGNCVYHVAHQSFGQWFNTVGQNVEMTNFTQALYDARELAMERMQAEATHLQAEGIVGVNIHEGSYGWSSHVIEFFTVGTAVIAMRADHIIPAPQLVLTVND